MMIKQNQKRINVRKVANKYLFIDCLKIKIYFLKVCAYKADCQDPNNLIARLCYKLNEIRINTLKENEQTLTAKNTYGNIFINVLEKSKSYAIINFSKIEAQKLNKLFFNSDLYGLTENKI